MPDLSVHDADLAVHDGRSRCSPSADPGVHDGPTWVFTMGRDPHLGLQGENGVLIDGWPVADHRLTQHLEQGEIPSEGLAATLLRGGLEVTPIFARTRVTALSFDQLVAAARKL